MILEMVKVLYKEHMVHDLFVSILLDTLASVSTVLTTLHQWERVLQKDVFVYVTKILLN